MPGYGGSACVLLPRLPLTKSLDVILKFSPFDLHALSTPPAFILSQDQTLFKEYGRDKIELT